MEVGRWVCKEVGRWMCRERGVVGLYARRVWGWVGIQWVTVITVNRWRPCHCHFSASPGAASGGQDLEGCPSRACHLPVLCHHDQQGAEAAACSPQEPSTSGGVQQVGAVLGGGPTLC